MHKLCHEKNLADSFITFFVQVSADDTFQEKLATTSDKRHDKAKIIKRRDEKPRGKKELEKIIRHGRGRPPRPKGEYLKELENASHEEKPKVEMKLIAKKYRSNKTKKEKKMEKTLKKIKKRRIYLEGIYCVHQWDIIDLQEMIRSKF